MPKQFIPASGIAVLFLTTSLLIAADPVGKDIPLGSSDFVPSPEHPVGFRGDGTGRFPGATPPMTWNVTKGAGVKWHTPLPGDSASSVIVVGKKIFAVGSPHNVYCLDADTGAVLWQQDVDPVSCLAPDEAVKLRQELATLVADSGKETASDPKKRNPRIDALAAKGVVSNDFKYDNFFSLSAPTPASDGQRVYVQFPAGVLAAYDLDGKRLWMVPAISSGWSMGNSSPVTYQNKVLAIVGGRYSPKVFCVEAATGKTLWSVKFSVPHAHAGAGSPLIVSTAEGPKVVTSVYSMFDLETGKEWFSHDFYNDYGSSPVVDGTRVFFIHGDHGKGTTKRQLVILDCSVKGPPVITSYPRNGSPGWSHSSLLFEGKIFIPERGGSYPEIMDVTTGKILVDPKQKIPLAKVGKTDGYLNPSPTWAGGHIYHALMDGQVLVLDSTIPLKILATNQVAPMNGSPFFQGSRIYFRTRDAVWCIADK